MYLFTHLCFNYDVFRWVWVFSKSIWRIGNESWSNRNSILSRLVCIQRLVSFSWSHFYYLPTATFWLLVIIFVFMWYCTVSGKVPVFEHHLLSWWNYLWQHKLFSHSMPDVKYCSSAITVWLTQESIGFGSVFVLCFRFCLCMTLYSVM